MKLTKTKANWLFKLILVFHTLSEQTEASHDDEVRILMVGSRGQSRFSAADLLSGRKDGGQEDREIVKTPVITDEARRIMLITGPNLCEEDTARQTFTTALFLSSPGPHVVLMLLNLEDQQSQQCDIVKRAQELPGAEVLQHCIVLLLQNHQERFTGASRGIAGEMINACGGRFHIIRDSEPKPARRAALVAQIDKLVWLNHHRFYSVLRQKLETEKNNKAVNEENQLLPVIYDTLGGAVGNIGWIFLVSLTAFVIYTKGRDKILNFTAKFAALVLFMVYLRHILSPDVVIPLNLALLSSIATILTKTKVMQNLECSRISQVFEIQTIMLQRLLYMMGSALVLGSIISIRTWSDVLIACYTAPGVTVGAYTFIILNEIFSHESPVFAFGSFLCCSVGATISVWFVNEVGGIMTIIVLIYNIYILTYLFKKKEMRESLIVCNESAHGKYE